MKIKKTKESDFKERADKFVAEVDKLQKKYNVGFNVAERKPYYLSVQDIVKEAPKK